MNTFVWQLERVALALLILNIVKELLGKSDR